MYPIEIFHIDKKIRPAALLKRASGTGVFLCWYGTPLVAASVFRNFRSFQPLLKRKVKALKNRRILIPNPSKSLTRFCEPPFLKAPGDLQVRSERRRKINRGCFILI